MNSCLSTRQVTMATLSSSAPSSSSSASSSGGPNSSLDENAPRDFNVTRYYESEALDSIVETGLHEEYLLLAYVGLVRVGKIAKGPMGLTSSCLQFNLITFTDVLSATEAMMSSMKAKLNKKSKAPGPVTGVFSRKRPLLQRQDGHYLPELSKDSDCFFIDDNPRYRIGIFANGDGTVSMGRLFKDDASTSSKGTVHGFEISRSSLLRFENVPHFIRFLKTTFDMAITSYAKKVSFIPIVFFLFNKLMKLTKDEKEDYCSRGVAALEEMLPDAVKFANNGTDYLIRDPKKFTQTVRMSPFMCEEVGSADFFFKNWYRIYNLGSYYLGDAWDVEKTVFSEKKKKSKVICMEKAKKDSNTVVESGKRIKTRMVEDDEDGDADDLDDGGFFDDEDDEDDEVEENRDMPLTQSF